MHFQIILLCGFITLFTDAEVVTWLERSHKVKHFVATKTSKPEESSEKPTDLTKHNTSEIVSEEDLENRLKLAKNNLTVIMFYNKRWYISRLVSPFFWDMKKNFTDVVFLKVDVHDNRAISNQYNIVKLPTFVFLKNNTRLYTIKGPSIKKLREKIQKYTVKNNLI